MSEAVDRVGDARELERPADDAALLDVPRVLIEAHARRVGIHVRRADCLPDDVHPVVPVPVAQPKALARHDPFDQEAAEAETAGLDGRYRKSMVDQAVHHLPAVGEEEEEVRLAEVRMDARAEHDADLARRIVEREPEALVPERERVGAGRVPGVVLGRCHVAGRRHRSAPPRR